MSETTRRNFSAGTRGSRLSIGTILFGLILLSIGVLWLLDVADVIDVTWTVVGAVMLILVGLALIVGAREGSHGGLVFLGIVLSAVVLIGTVASWPSIGGGVGGRTIQPETIDAVEETYSWGVGSQTIDLREVEFPEGETNIAIQLGTGQIEVRIPEGLGYQIQWQAGVGNVEVLDRQQSGFGLEGTYVSDDFDEQDRQLVIDIQVGMGSIEVRQ